MLTRKNTGRIALCLVTVALSVSFLYAASLDGYKFSVKNSTKSVILKILVSKDGKKWGFLTSATASKPDKR